MALCVSRSVDNVQTDIVEFKKVHERLIRQTEAVLVQAVTKADFDVLLRMSENHNHTWKRMWSRIGTFKCGVYDCDQRRGGTPTIHTGHSLL